MLVAASELGAEAAAKALAELLAAGRAVEITGPEGQRFVMTATALEAVAERAIREVRAFQDEHSLRRGLPKEELRSRLQLNPRVFPALLQYLSGVGRLADHGAAVATGGWQPAPSAAEQTLADAYLAVLKSSPFGPPLDARPADELVAYLDGAALVVDVGGGVVFEAGAYREMVGRIVARMREQGTITLAEVRDMFGNSRRYAQALLEHLDQRRITVRRGDERVPGRASSEIAAAGSGQGDR